jgi:hypothetical protein
VFKLYHIPVRLQSRLLCDALTHYDIPSLNLKYYHPVFYSVKQTAFLLPYILWYVIARKIVDATVIGKLFEETFSPPIIRFWRGIFDGANRIIEGWG